MYTFFIPVEVSDEPMMPSSLVKHNMLGRFLPAILKNDRQPRI